MLHMRDQKHLIIEDGRPEKPLVSFLTGLALMANYILSFAVMSMIETFIAA